MIETRRIPLTLIDRVRRLRPVKPDWAAVMADDIARGVELPPILVRPASPDEVGPGCAYELVIGGHRFEAHRLAGRDDIRADIEEMSSDEAILREAEENLKRNNPDPIEMVVFLTARDAAYKRLYPETARGGDRRSAAAIKRRELPFDGAISFAADAAQNVGLGERSIRDYISVGRKLSSDVIPLLFGTEIGTKLAELKAFAAHNPETQVHLAHLLAKGEARDIKGLRIAAGLDAPAREDREEAIYNKLVELYGRAAKRTKLRFEEHVGLVIRNERGGA